MSKLDKAATQKLSKVKLLKPHNHAGALHAVGAEIEVNEADKAWLIEQDVIAGKAVAEPLSNQEGVTQ